MKYMFRGLMFFALLFSSMSHGMILGSRLTKHYQTRLFTTIPPHHIFVNQPAYEIGITPGGILKSPKEVVKECDAFLTTMYKRTVIDSVYAINHYRCWVEELQIAKKLHRNALYAYYMSDQYQGDKASQSDFREIIYRSRDYTIDPEKFHNFKKTNTHVTNEEKSSEAYLAHCNEEEARILNECENIDSKDRTYKLELKSHIEKLEQ